MSRLTQTKGFTIVELLIVIVVIAILAAITAVAFNGVQQRSKNSAIESTVTAYRKILELYKTSYGSYAMTGTGTTAYCLGDVAAYPNNCYSASPNATFASELQKVATTLPVPSSDCLTYGASCRRNMTFMRNAAWTIDGTAHLYYLIYFLNGATKCGQSGSLEGTWGSFSRTQTKGYFERSGSDTTMCMIEITDP